MSPAKASSPSAEAGFTASVLPILQNKCAPCHLKGGDEDFSHVDVVRKNIDEILMRVQLDPSDHRYMPFKEKKPALTADEIAALKNWKASL